MGKTAAQLAYTSPGFQALSEAVQDLDGHRDGRRWGKLVGTVVRRRRELWAGIGLLRSLPSLEVRLSDDSAGRAIRERLAAPSRRLARASLRLPDDPAAYLRGRPKQAVRTNLRHAADAGITCRHLAGPEAQASGLAAFVAEGGWGEEEWARLTAKLGVTGGEQDLHLAEDADGRPVALAAVDADRECAYLAYLKALDGPVSGPARYALSVHLVQSLIERDVDVLLVGNAMRLSPGLQYFQQRLGFEVCNVRLAAS